MITNASKSKVNAKNAAVLYRKRWRIETAFQELKHDLNSEINTLGYPPAALFAFCVALVAYMIVAVIKGGPEQYTRGQKGRYWPIGLLHGRRDFGRLPRYDDCNFPDKWYVFRNLSHTELVALLRQLAANVNMSKFKKHPRGPKKPSQQRVRDPKHPHVSTADYLRQGKASENDYLERAAPISLKEGADVFWQTCLRSGDGPSSHAHVPPLCRSVQREPEGSPVHLSGSIPVHGFRPIDLSRKPPGYRGLSSSTKQQALPYGIPNCGFQKHTVQCEQCARLENLCRVRTGTHLHRAEALCQRGPWPRSRQYRLCLGFYDDRPMSIRLSMGTFPENQRRGKAPYVTGFTRQYPNLHPHLRWKIARCERAGYPDSGTQFILRYGPWLHRLSTTIYSQPALDLLRNPRQVESPVSPSLLQSSRREPWSAVRSNHCADRRKCLSALPGETTPRKIPRRRHQQDARFSHQRLLSPCLHHRTAVSMPLAGRAFLQVDQAAPEDQSLFRSLRECSQKPDLDRCFGLCPRGNHSKEAFVCRPASTRFLQVLSLTVFERIPVITNTYGWPL